MSAPAAAGLVYNKGSNSLLSWVFATESIACSGSQSRHQSSTAGVGQLIEHVAVSTDPPLPPRPARPAAGAMRRARSRSRAGVAGCATGSRCVTRTRSLPARPDHRSVAARPNLSPARAGPEINGSRSSWSRSTSSRSRFVPASEDDHRHPRPRLKAGNSCFLGSIGVDSIQASWRLEWDSKPCRSRPEIVHRGHAGSTRCGTSCMAPPTGEQADRIADAALRGLLADTGRAEPGPPGNPAQEEGQTPWNT